MSLRAAAGVPGSRARAVLAAAWPAVTAALLLGYAMAPARFPEQAPHLVLGVALAEIVGLGFAGTARVRGKPGAWRVELRRAAAWTVFAVVAVALALRMPAALAAVLLWLAIGAGVDRLRQPVDAALDAARGAAVTRDRLSLLVALLLLTTAVAAAVGLATLLGMAEPAWPEPRLLAWPLAGYFAALARLQAHMQGAGFARERRRLLDRGWIRRIEDLVFDR